MAGRIVSAVLSVCPIERTDRSIYTFMDFDFETEPDADVWENTVWKLWPAYSGMVMDGTDAGNYPMYNTCVWNEYAPWPGGGRTLYIIQGVARDSVGQPIAGAQ